MFGRGTTPSSCVGRTARTPTTPQRGAAQSRAAERSRSHDLHGHTTASFDGVSFSRKLDENATPRARLAKLVYDAASFDDASFAGKSAVDSSTFACSRSHAEMRASSVCARGCAAL